MKRKMIRAILLLIITFIALLVFIGLYIDETKQVQKTYRRQYNTELGHVSGEIEGYLNAEGGHDTRYSMIISYMSSANSFAFLLNGFNEQQKAVNEITFSLIKYPEQMANKMEDLKKAVDDILDGLDKGYDELREIVSGLDKQGN